MSDQAALENGKVIEQGTHEKLLSLKGKYTDFYKKQFTQL